MRRFFPPYVYNPITFFGAGLSGLSFGLILFLTVLEFLSPETKPYMGIITFIILPIFLVSGIFLLVFGLLRERRRLERGILRKKRFWIIDLNDPRQRRMLATVSIGALIFMFVSAFGSYKAYEFSETDEFCGTICQKPGGGSRRSTSFSPDISDRSNGITRSSVTSGPPPGM